MEKVSYAGTYPRRAKYINTLKGRLNHIYNNAKYWSKKRNQPCPLLINHLWWLWDHQDGKCAYSGMEMETTSGSPKLVSLKRLDDSKPYMPGNIQFVCSSVASMGVSGMSPSDFVEMCKAVSNHMAAV